MTRYILLLRAINVGGKNLLPMKELRTVLEKANYSNVKTYIQSGNVILDAPKNPEKEIKALIDTNFHFIPEIMVLTATAFSAIVLNNPYSEYEGKRVHIYICKQCPTLQVEKTRHLAADTEQYTLIDKVFYLYAQDGIARSKLVANIEKCLGVAATGRNLNTINKLNAMIDNID